MTIPFCDVGGAIREGYGGGGGADSDAPPWCGGFGLGFLRTGCERRRVGDLWFGGEIGRAHV